MEKITNLEHAKDIISNLDYTPMIIDKDYKEVQERVEDEGYKMTAALIKKAVDQIADDPYHTMMANISNKARRSK